MLDCLSWQVVGTLNQKGASPYRKIASLLGPLRLTEIAKQEITVTVSYQGKKYKKVSIKLATHVSDEFKDEVKKLIDAEDDKEGAKQALIEGYEGEGGIDELRDYDGITVTSDWTGEAMISEIEIDPDKVDFDDIKNSEDLGEICKMIKTYSPTLFIKNLEKNGFKEVK